MSNMIIIGAGLSGLLCAALNPKSTVIEASPKQSHNHKAVMRLRSPEIGRLTGIEFKKVIVHKAIWSKGEERPLTIALAHNYSNKVTGKMSIRSIFNLDPVKRYIPPPDFVERLEKMAHNIQYSTKVVKITETFLSCSYDQNPPLASARVLTPIVSTLPMPVMAKLLGASDPCPFEYDKIYVTQYKIRSCDSYCTMYYPDDEVSIYRATINGDTLIVESTAALTTFEEQTVLDSFGISFVETFKPSVINHIQPMGKITEVERAPRQRFISDCTIKYDIYALGRFATWRPSVMLDDILDDVFHIRNLIAKGNYAAISHNQED